MMKIAVCDDDRSMREQIASLIREQEPDAEVVTFETGEEMMKSQENFGISFLDVEMKEISGIDVAKHNMVSLHQLKKMQYSDDILDKAKWKMINGFTILTSTRKV